MTDCFTKSGLYDTFSATIMILGQMIQPEVQRLSLINRIESIDPSYIPIKLTGGIGDTICLLETIRFLSQWFKIVVYTDHLEAFGYFCKDVTAFKTMPNYAWHLEIDSLASFKCAPSFHGFLIKDHENLFLQQQDLFKVIPQVEHLKDSRKYFLISHFAKERGLTKVSLPLFSLGYDDGPEYLFMSRSTPNQIITIHDGVDGSQNINGRATKQWKWSHWNEIVKALKSKYPKHKIVQLGAKTSREIDGVDECLINRTTITEAFDVLSGSSLHIDGDSGLVHAATRMQVPCVVLWGPTPPDFYGYPQNINIRSGTCSSECYGVKENWNDKCPIGYSSPKCMDEILPETIMEALQNWSCLT